MHWPWSKRGPAREEALLRLAAEYAFRLRRPLWRDVRVEVRETGAAQLEERNGTTVLVVPAASDRRRAEWEVRSLVLDLLRRTGAASRRANAT